MQDEVQVTVVQGDMIYLQQCQVKCHGINKGDVNHWSPSTLWATEQYIFSLGIFKPSYRIDIL